MDLSVRHPGNLAWRWKFHGIFSCAEDCADRIETVRCASYVPRKQPPGELNHKDGLSATQRCNSENDQLPRTAADVCFDARDCPEFQLAFQNSGLFGVDC